MGLRALPSTEERLLLLSGVRGGTPRDTPAEDILEDTAGDILEDRLSRVVLLCFPLVIREPAAEVLFECLNLILALLCHLSQKPGMPLEVRVMGVAVIHSLSLPPFLCLSLSFPLLLSCSPYTVKHLWSTG